MNLSIRKSKGFSLVEVLVAVFIFAVGLLGIAGLQMAAKQNAFDTEQRTTAALLASEIAEKIRINSANGSAYVANAVNLPTLSLPTTNCSDTAPCTGADLAAFDLKNWYTAILGQNKTTQHGSGSSAGGLVSPSACISAVTQTISGTTTTIGYNIAIAWRGKIALSNPAANTCGQGSGLYGANDEYRRLLVITIAI